MYIALYKDKSHLFNNATAFWTKGTYSHTELVFSDGWSASSSFRDDGVRFKLIKFKPENWDFIDLKDKFNEETAREYFLKRVNREHWNDPKAPTVVKYDTFGLFGFVLSPIKDDTSKLFCSESTMDSLGFGEAYRFSPNHTVGTMKGFGLSVTKGEEFLRLHPELAFKG